MFDGIIQWFEKLPGIANMLLHNGLDQTLIIFFLTLVFGLTLGLVLALGRMTKFKIIQLPVRFYLLIMRGTPLILQLYGFYFGLNLLLGIRIERTMAAVVAFSLNYAAYFAEIYRSGIQAIPNGQYEAAKVLGFGKAQTFFKIILPQVVKIILPPMGSECMTLVKDTSLAHVIGVMEIYVVAANNMSRSRGMEYLIVAGIFYLIMNMIVSKVFGILEKRMSYYR
ncbi:amino acid ABC transporter permease [Anaerostipes sp.]|uniref:amino acid ABC transporter permease n=1 Tax=Anaerostipes sp. TaxID=1872530 RepID=UPI0025BE848B|nr:amino acid ABC transporter permease [Anaerostipes sp.]MBS7007183.1 amino acid ABC transporter permease [Anaerostipes sp.]